MSVALVTVKVGVLDNACLAISPTPSKNMTVVTVIPYIEPPNIRRPSKFCSILTNPWGVTSTRV